MIPNFTLDLTKVVAYLISLFFCFVVQRWVVPFINQKKEELKQKTNADTYNLLCAVCNTAVYFVQQVYWQCDGEEKKQHAIQSVLSQLESMGITVDIAQISDCIESEVRKMKDALKSTEE